MAQDKRKVADCRLIPSDKRCSVSIAGTEEEVTGLALRHAIQDHGHKDSPELRTQLRSMLRDEA